ncbi:MAG TPA: amidase [Acidimicrobiales bacterium]|nr:amidase [Acidimicrobiales bacterium]
MKSAVELLAEVRSGDVSATEVVAAHLELFHQVEEATSAVIAFDDERALSDAARLDEAFAKAGPVGLLHGLPITVKDWIDVEGFPCAGNRGAFDRWPANDATVVSRLRAAGAVVLGKTRASGSGPAVRHPFDSTRTPGGSSSGEACVVAAGASPLGIGSDSGGSIRLPAGWCGVFGLKPTSGRVPGTGHFPAFGALSDGRTQIGPLARSVDDLELALQVIAGPDFRDAGVAPVPLQSSEFQPLEGKRFAVLTGEGPWTAAPAAAAAVEAAARRLEAAGLERTDWPMPWLVPAMDITLRYWERHELTGEAVDQQLENWDEFRNNYVAVSEEIELLLTPTAADVAPLLRENTREDYVFTLPASLTGSPALAMPTGPDEVGLPLGVQMIGRPWEDHLILAIARLLAAPQQSQ